MPHPKKSRRSIRLKNYDYSQDGAYFITVCTKNRENLFGEIVEGEMTTNQAGKIIENIWEQLPKRFPNIELDEFTVMPNHFHGIIIIGNDQSIGQPQGIAPYGYPSWVPRLIGQPQGIAPTDIPRTGAPRGYPLGEIIGAFKSLTTNKYIHGVKSKIFPQFEKYLWQRNFYEHIIRNEKSFENIQEYIENNPRNWDKDILFG